MALTQCRYYLAMKNFLKPRAALTYLFAQALSFGALAAGVHQGVAVSDAWIRATVPGQTASGAFMRITSEETASLVGFTTDLASTHQLHEMRMDGDVMRMRELDQVSLPAGKTVGFGPGSMHFMLLDLKKPLVAGESAPITLVVRLSNGKQVRITTEARIERRNPYETTPSPSTATH